MSDTASESRVPQLAAGCRIRTLAAEETVLLVPEGVLRMQGTAGEIIKLIDGVSTVGEIILCLQQKYDTAPPAQIVAEVQSFLDKLHSRSVLLFTIPQPDDSAVRPD
jgi:pyrroloquinoline quinone biosynthesis protein D